MVAVVEVVVHRHEVPPLTLAETHETHAPGSGDGHGAAAAAAGPGGAVDGLLGLELPPLGGGEDEVHAEAGNAEAALEAAPLATASGRKGGLRLRVRYKNG